MSYPQEPPYPQAPGQLGGQQPFEGAQPPTPQAAYAHWGLRVGAYFIDGLVVLPFYAVASIAEALGTPSDPYGDPAGWAIAVAIVFNLIGAAVAIWNIIFRQGRTGQSIGKGALNIKLVSESSGQPIGPGLAFMRQLAHILDAIPAYIGFLWPLWDAKKQTFADKILKTVVVKS